MCIVAPRAINAREMVAYKVMERVPGGHMPIFAKAFPDKATGERQQAKTRFHAFKSLKLAKYFLNTLHYWELRREVNKKNCVVVKVKLEEELVEETEGILSMKDAVGGKYQTVLEEV